MTGVYRVPRKKPLPVAAGPTPRLLRIAEAARYLGATVWFIRGLIWARKVPYLRLGRRYVLDVRDLDNYIQRQKLGTQ